MIELSKKMEIVGFILVPFGPFNTLIFNFLGGLKISPHNSAHKWINKTTVFPPGILWGLPLKLTIYIDLTPSFTVGGNAMSSHYYSAANY